MRTQLRFLIVSTVSILGIAGPFGHLSSVAKESKFGRTQMVDRQTLNIGDLVPDFNLKDRRGRSHRLSDFRGNLVFLNFWATWCPPCVDELPLMDALNLRYKAKNFTMIGVSVDDDWSTVNEFFDERGRAPSFLVLLDAKKEVSSKSYGTSKFPETYIIGPTGILLKKYIGAFNWLSAEKLDDIDDFLSRKAQ